MLMYDFILTLNFLTSIYLKIQVAFLNLTWLHFTNYFLPFIYAAEKLNLNLSAYNNYVWFYRNLNKIERVAKYLISSALSNLWGEKFRPPSHSRNPLQQGCDSSKKILRKKGGGIGGNKKYWYDSKYPLTAFNLHKESFLLVYKLCQNI